MKRALTFFVAVVACILACCHTSAQQYPAENFTTEIPLGHLVNLTTVEGIDNDFKIIHSTIDAQYSVEPEEYQNTTAATVFIPLLNVTTVGIDIDNDIDETIHRIVGGRPISVREAPYQVALIENGAFICGASVINQIWVMTAAHCVTDGGRFVVRAGSRFFKRGGQTRRIRRIVINGGYNPRTSNNDIALLRVNRRFRFGRNLRAVRLTGPRKRLPSTLFVSGWGTTNENFQNPTRGLRGVRIRVVPLGTCWRQYRGQARITQKMVCATARGKDSCYGDSGGPVVNNGVQYGIVSFGIGCARARYPSVNTDVRRQIAWIRRVVRRHS